MDEKAKERENEKENQERRLEGLRNAGIAGGAYETVQRYGAAAKEHYVAYSGQDNEAGKTLSKSLKSISKEKVNSDYKFQNEHQQAGFSAEVKDTARDNAERIINGDSNRTVRTDDIGRVNDPLYDTVEIDANGNVIDGSGTQMKFVGASQNDPTGEGDAARALSKLQSKKFEKYLDADAKIKVPSDQYDKMIQEADNRIEKLSKQLEKQKASGNTEAAQKTQKQIENLQKIKKNLRKSYVSTAEAQFARNHPELSTAIDVAKVAHRAGVEALKSGVVIGGSLSIVRNIVALCKGEIEPEEAVANVAKDTASSAGMAYVTGASGAAIKGAMQNAKSETVRALSKTNVPAIIVSVSVQTAKVMKRYLEGEIDGVECMEQLGQEGVGMISSSMFALVGQAVIPVPILGGLIGGMVGYAFASANYGVLMDALKDEKLAHEQRIQIERACEEHIKMIREYRAEMEKLISEYLSESMDVFRESFSGIKNALAIGDVDWFIDSANSITEQFGGKASFSNMDEFDNMMLSGSTFKL